MIGHADALPWRLPTDLRHFKAATLGKPVLMGRRTFDSIGGPLPGRPTVVVSRDVAFRPEGVTCAPDLDAAIAAATAIGRDAGAGEVMVAGGGTIYAALIARAQRLVVTEVDLAPAGDTLFPVIDPALWREVARTTPAPDPRDAAAVAFVTYERR